ncbi:hypothetical protein JOB18_024532 [Solea senegalensis]|uniref:Uncharacterized protein n=1 Tax=Solea senegalensis TaxID=28829 RepID=A0AAV6R7X4_SOLSE|nr:hypothetical protein JOB18_024532 [Solea senegalensis]
MILRRCNFCSAPLSLAFVKSHSAKGKVQRLSDPGLFSNATSRQPSGAPRDVDKDLYDSSKDFCPSHTQSFTRVNATWQIIFTPPESMWSNFEKPPASSCEERCSNTQHMCLRKQKHGSELLTEQDFPIMPRCIEQKPRKHVLCVHRRHRAFPLLRTSEELPLVNTFIKVESVTTDPSCGTRSHTADCSHKHSLVKGGQAQTLCRLLTVSVSVSVLGSDSNFHGGKPCGTGTHTHLLHPPRDAILITSLRFNLSPLDQMVDVFILEGSDRAVAESGRLPCNVQSLRRGLSSLEPKTCGETQTELQISATLHIKRVHKSQGADKRRCPYGIETKAGSEVFTAAFNFVWERVEQNREEG